MKKRKRRPLTAATKKKISRALQGKKRRNRNRKIKVAGAIGVGAVASGYLINKRFRTKKTLKSSGLSSGTEVPPTITVESQPKPNRVNPRPLPSRKTVTPVKLKRRPNGRFMKKKDSYDSFHISRKLKINLTPTGKVNARQEIKTRPGRRAASESRRKRLNG